jgi:hypothetical protein
VGYNSQRLKLNVGNQRVTSQDADTRLDAQLAQ